MNVNGADIGGSVSGIYDPSKDPAVGQWTDEAMAGRKRVEAGTDKYLSAIPEQPGAAGPPPQQPPTSNIQPIMQSMVPLMLFTAIGGAFSKQNGYSMMGALNGMVKGMNKGDEEGRKRAFQQYQETYTQWHEKVEESHRLHDEMVKALAGRVDADQRATEFALKMRGDAIQTGQYNAEQIRAEKKWLQQQKESNVKIQKMQGDIGNQKEVDKALRMRITIQGKLDAVEQGVPRMETAYKAVEASADLLPKLLEKYKKDNMGVTAPESFADFITRYSSDPEVGQFAGNINTLKAALVVLDVAGAGGMRGNMFVQKLFAATAPQLFSMSGAQAKTQLLNDRGMIEQAVALSREHVQQWKAMRDKTDETLKLRLPSSAPDSEASIDDILEKYK
jgi:hypothetical protein